MKTPIKEIQSTIVFRADPEAERRLIETVKSWHDWKRILRPGQEHEEPAFKGDDDFRDAVHEVICACLQERWEDVAETWHSLNTARSREVRANAPPPTVRPPGKPRRIK